MLSRERCGVKYTPLFRPRHSEPSEQHNKMNPTRVWKLMSGDIVFSHFNPGNRRKCSNDEPPRSSIVLRVVPTFPARIHPPLCTVLLPSLHHRPSQPMRRPIATRRMKGPGTIIKPAMLSRKNANFPLYFARRCLHLAPLRISSMLRPTLRPISSLKLPRLTVSWLWTLRSLRR